MQRALLVTGLLLAYASRANGGDLRGVTHVGMVAPDIVGVTFEDGYVEYGAQTPYAKRPGDVVDTSSHHRWLSRGGKAIGALVGAGQDTLWSFDTLHAEQFEPRYLDSPNSYSLHGPDGPLTPRSVHRKSKPTDFGRVEPWAFGTPSVHTVCLRLADPLTEGAEYSLTFADDALPPHSFRVGHRELRSEAVHVSHIGFRPDDTAKVAFLSCWMGDGGASEYASGMPFEVVNVAIGAVAFRGETILSKRADDLTEDPYGRNYNGVDVYALEFGDLTTPGEYRVAVPGVGCSYPFRIDRDTWRDAFVVSARGFYHQRSGIALGPPYTDFTRPRSFHPADGMVVYESAAALMDTGNGLNGADSNFGVLVSGRTDRIVDDAWGGYMDAGDWDRRIQHLIASRLLLELADEFPAFYGALSLNIPESANTLPDIVDEALFNLDFYRRLQTTAGGIRGGIESEEHPRNGEGSGQESLGVMAYAPGIWSSYEYAGVAAQAARVLHAAPELAATYRESALRAMRWAEGERAGRHDEDPHAVDDARNLAAVELYRLTDDAEWHELFLATTAFTDSAAPLYLWQNHDQAHAAWSYLHMDDADDDVRDNCRRALLAEAEERVAQGERTAFGWTKNPWAPVAWGALAAPDGVTLARAHRLTGDSHYLDALTLACQTGAGANPVNVCYTTGLGHVSPRHPLHIDSRLSHQEPPPGLTVFGPKHLDGSEDWALRFVDQVAHPPAEEWPTMEAFWDVFWYPAVCEFTVQQPMARNAYAWGYLAAR